MSHLLPPTVLFGIVMLRGAPDPEFCYPAGSGSTPDPAGSGSEPDPSHFPDPCRILTCRIRIQTSTTADNRRKIALSAPQLEKLE